MSDYEPGDTLVEALRRSNPVPVDRALSRRSQPSAQALFADIVAERPRRVRSRVLVLVVVVVLVAAMLMAFVALHRVGTSLSIAPVCYESDSLQAPNVVVTAGDPKQACASLWAGGRFGRSVPDFDVCVLPSGVLAVFPGESGSVCSRLDLPASSGDNSVERFVDALNRRVSARCFRLDQAAQIAKEELKRRRLAGWRILPGDGTADAVRTCASIGADPSARTIALVPILNPTARVAAWAVNDLTSRRASRRSLHASTRAASRGRVPRWCP